MPATVALVLATLAAGGLVAAPRGALPGTGDGYAVRFALPAADPSVRLAATPARRQAPLDVLAQAPLPDAAEPAPPEVVASAAATTLPVPNTARPAARGKVPGVLALNYSLAGGPRAGDAIEVEKPLSIGQAEAGRIPLRIDGNAKVYALGSRLAAIIAAQSGAGAIPDGLDQDFVSLERLRALGIAIRYDAIRDRLVIDPPA
jgi:hypothetical protein